MSAEAEQRRTVHRPRPPEAYCWGDGRRDLEESHHDPGIRIVLECIPLRSVLEQIETALRRIIAPIPAKPTPVQTVTPEPPRIVTPQEAR